MRCSYVSNRGAKRGQQCPHNTLNEFCYRHSKAKELVGCKFEGCSALTRSQYQLCTEHGVAKEAAKAYRAKKKEKEEQLQYENDMLKEELFEAELEAVFDGEEI